MLVEIFTRHVEIFTKTERTGIYYSRSLNNSNFIYENTDTINFLDEDYQYQGYGVCDTIDQILEYYDFENDSRKFAIFLTAIYKEDQPEEYGFRFSKWGPYIGTKELIGADYIYDEPNVDMVYVWEVLEIKD